jgi:hypothetical protein
LTKDQEVSQNARKQSVCPEVHDSFLLSVQTTHYAEALH